MTNRRSGCRCASVRKPSRTAQEIKSLRFHAIERPADASGGRFGGHVEHEGPIRFDSAHGHSPDAPHRLDVQSARVPLVDDVGEQEPIGHDDLAGVECGANHLFDQLGSSGHIEKHFAATVDTQIRSMQQDLAEFVPERRASRVAAEDHVASLRPEPFDEQLNLRRFTGAIDTVKRHEHAPATRVKKSSEPVRVASIAVGRGQP